MRRTLVRAGIEADLATPRGNGDHIAGLGAERSQVERVEQRYRVGLDRIENAGATGHAASMPMLELPPGNEHQGIVTVGSLVRRDDIGGDEPRLSGRGGGRTPQNNGPP